MPRASNDDNASATVHNTISSCADGAGGSNVKDTANSWGRTAEQAEESDSDGRDGSVTIGDVQGESEGQCHVRSIC